MTVFDANTFLVRPVAVPPIPNDAKVYAAEVRLVPSIVRREARPDERKNQTSDACASRERRGAPISPPTPPAAGGQSQSASAP